MLATAAERVRHEGLTLDLAEMDLADLIRSSGVSRSTVFRIWPDRAAFVADVLRRLFDDSAATPTGFDEETLGIVERVIADHAALMSTRDGRHVVLRIAAREAMRHNFTAVSTSASWRTYRMLLAVASASDRSLGGPGIRGLLQEIELRYLDRMESVYAGFNRAFRRAMRPGVSERDLGIMVASVIEGLVDRSALLPALVGPPRPVALDDEDVQPWHVSALAVYSLFMTMTEDADAD